MPTCKIEQVNRLRWKCWHRCGQMYNHGAGAIKWLLTAVANCDRRFRGLFFETPCATSVCLLRIVCTPEQYRCNNGQCIPGPKRCDLTVDCLDGSDESACSKCR